MQRIKRRDLEVTAAVKLIMQPKPIRREFDDYDRMPSERVIGHIVGVVLDEVFRGDAVVIRPDPVITHPITSTGVSDCRVAHPGEWDKNEPWPACFGPKPTREQDV